MQGPDRPMQIMWTSSSNAKKEAFQLDDVQHVHGLVLFLSSTLCKYFIAMFDYFVTLADSWLAFLHCFAH